MFAAAAEQYLEVADEVNDVAERHMVADLLRRAVLQTTLIGDYSLVDALLAAALRLIDPGETATLAEVHIARHAALYSLGRLDEADEEYQTIGALCPAATERGARAIRRPSRNTIPPDPRARTRGCRRRRKMKGWR